MSIVVLSKGSYTMGTEVAERVAERLGYRCLAREVLLEASTEFNVPEAKLVHAVRDSLSMVDRILHSRQRYIAYIRCALLQELCHDEVVYHGFAGNFLVNGVDHVLKARIEAELSARVALGMARDNVSSREARARIERIDQERHRWSEQLYGIDFRDPSLFDLTLHLGRLSTHDAVDLICRAVDRKQFQTTPDSQQALEDLALAALVNVALIELAPEIEVGASAGHIVIRALPQVTTLAAAAARIEGLASAVPGVKSVRIEHGSSAAAGGEHRAP